MYFTEELCTLKGEICQNNNMFTTVTVATFKREYIEVNAIMDYLLQSRKISNADSI